MNKAAREVFHALLTLLLFPNVFCGKRQNAARILVEEIRTRLRARERKNWSGLLTDFLAQYPLLICHQTEQAQCQQQQR